MSKVLELSEETYERLLVLAQQRQCTPEELIHTFLIDYEQARYDQANQQMLAQGILASIPQTPCGLETAFTPVAIPGPPLSRTILDARR
jgi:hypothetical protein